MSEVKALGWYFVIMAAAVIMASCAPGTAHASKAKELTEACKENPQHQVCVDLAEKKAKSKARADAKLQAKIDAVLSK